MAAASLATPVHCSDCGRPLRRLWIQDDCRERHVCTACGITHYQNPRVIVGCLVSWQGKILLCRRSQEPARGQWTVPSGYLECDETLEEGAARETFEETGVRVDPAALDLCMVINMTAIQQVTIAFRTELTEKPVVRAGSECLEAAFVSENEIPAKDIAWHEEWGNGLKRFFSELQHRNFTIQLITLGSSQGAGFKTRGYSVQGCDPRRQVES